MMRPVGHGRGLTPDMAGLVGLRIVLGARLALFRVRCGRLVELFVAVVVAGRRSILLFHGAGRYYVSAQRAYVLLCLVALFRSHAEIWPIPRFVFVTGSIVSTDDTVKAP
jgi:hypothetical protein